MADRVIPIDYQVGDVIEPKDERYRDFKSKVLDINEKGIIVQFIGYEADPILIRHHEGHLMTKSKVGTVLYGSKDKKHSSS
jgi:hypothetical protein